jgi:sec-independent protein translocase protein TatC
MSVGVLVLTAIIGAVYFRQILTFIMGRFDLTGINMVLTSPYQVIELAIQTGIYLGLVVTFPLLIWNIMSFLKPALEEDEYHIITSLLPFCLVLFVMGFFFGIWVMNFIISLFAKATLDFSIGNIWDISRFFGQILFSGVTLGIVFQFPILLTVLMKFNLMSRAQIIARRPYFYTAGLIIAAALPPTDILSLVLLVLPLLILFEATLLFNRPKPETSLQALAETEEVN